MIMLALEGLNVKCFMSQKNILPPTQLSLLLALDKGKTEKKRKEDRDGQICRKRKGKKNHFS